MDMKIASIYVHRIHNNKSKGIAHLCSVRRLGSCLPLLRIVENLETDSKVTIPT